MPESKRTVKVIFRYSEGELEAFKKFLQENNIHNQSNFIRDAIKHERERIENPIQENSMGVSKETIQLIKSQGEAIKKLSQRLDNRNVILEGIKERFNHMNGKDKKDYSNEIKTIKNYFTQYEQENQYVRPLTVQEIIDGTKLDKGDVLHVLTESGFFKSKGKGWVVK